MVSSYSLFNRFRYLSQDRKTLIVKLLGEDLEPPLQDCSFNFSDNLTIDGYYTLSYNKDKSGLLKQLSSGKAKIIDSNIEELYASIDNNLYPLYSDFINYTVDPNLQQSIGFTGVTELPLLDLNEIEKEINSIIEKEKPVSKFDELNNNFEAFLYKIFSKDEQVFIMINSKGNFQFALEIEDGSEESLNNIASVKLRNHNATKLDAIDGEYVFIKLMNPILKELGFEFQFKLDRKAYKNMGDNGDFAYGTQRLDIKTRQRKKADYRYNLLVNADIIPKGFNEFVLVHREGDHNLTGRQRRVTIIGYVPASVVEAKNPIRLNGGSKYEVDVNDMHDLKNLVIKVIEEVSKVESK